MWWWWWWNTLLLPSAPSPSPLTLKRLNDHVEKQDRGGVWCFSRPLVRSLFLFFTLIPSENYKGVFASSRCGLRGYCLEVTAPKNDVLSMIHARRQRRNNRGWVSGLPRAHSVSKRKGFGFVCRYGNEEKRWSVLIRQSSVKPGLGWWVRIMECFEAFYMSLFLTLSLSLLP